MASIRRTLSPVPRQGISLSGEVCSVASPLSKSSSCTQTYPSATSRVLSSVLGLSDQAFLFGVYSPRSTRSLDRSKQKGPIWRKAVIHFFMCFLIGVFIGFTPFSSMTFTMYPTTKYEVLSSNIASNARNSPVDDAETGKEILISDTEAIKINTTAELLVDKPESGNGVSSDDISNNLILVQESNVVPRKLLIIVTPTYAWPFQKYYLNRLAQTLKLVQPPLLWIAVEMNSQSVEIAEILRRTGVMYRHLVCNKNLTDIKDRNVDLRNAALAHIETHHLDGIVYFADDSNVYSIDLFDQMRQIRRFGTWKVAKLSRNSDKAIAEGPVCNETQVIGWNTEQANRRNRRFHAEISGFAFNSTILWDPKRWHRPTMEPIRQFDSVEDDLKTSAFIEQIVEDESQMEGLPQDCSKIMVWQLSLEPMSFITNEHTILRNGGYDISKPI